MKSKDKLLIVSSWLLCALSLACAAWVAAVFVVPSMTIRIRYFTLLVVGVFVFLAGGIFLRSRTNVNESVRQHLVTGSVIFIFALYVLVFLSLVLFTKVISNDSQFTFAYNKFWLSEALPRLVPFSSIATQLGKFAQGETSGLILAVNIGGNLLLYTPLAFFLPAFSKNMRVLDSFFPFIVFVVVFVELAQGMFGLGSFETDDMILGIGGALIAYAVINYTPIKDFCERNYLYI